MNQIVRAHTVVHEHVTYKFKVCIALQEHIIVGLKVQTSTLTERDTQEAIK